VRQPDLDRPLPSSGVRVGLDVTPLLGGPGGVATFVRELLAGLATRPGAPEIVPYVLSRRARRADLAAVAETAVRRVPLPAAVARPLWRTVGHPAAERWLGDVDVVHGTNFVVPPARSASRIVTVHDLSYVHEGADLAGSIVAFDRDVAAAVASGVTLHVPSRTVAAEVRARYPAAEVAVVEEGVRPPAVAPVLSDAPRCGGPEVLLAVGRTEHRKQLDRLVRAFGLLAPRRPGLALVLAGPPGRAEPDVEAAIAALPAGIAGRVQRRRSPGDAVRDRLYRDATIVVHPSRYEGFGLPVLEAMAHGVPVLAAASGAVREVAGDAAAFVPTDATPDELASAICDLLDDPGRRDALAGRGASRAAGYSWERTAAEMLALYHRVLGRRR
jgi:glycosyltransferase involved in cell wall biosynthesis